MSSHEIFMNVYANDRNAARLREAQVYRQNQASRQPNEATTAWRNAGRYFLRLVGQRLPYQNSGASYHLG